MDLRAELTPLLANDPRFSIEAYLFIFEAIEHTKSLRRSGIQSQLSAKLDSLPPKAKPKASRKEHVTGRELCLGIRDLLWRQYGMMSLAIVRSWGLRTSADIGAIVFHMVDSGDLDATKADSPADFQDVLTFDDTLRSGYQFDLDSLLL